MADIAIAFHWPLSDLERLGIAQIAQWRERARIRFEPREGSP